MIRHIHKCIATFFACASLTCPLALSPAVGKVSKPRWGLPLVEFVIVVQMGRFAQGSRACSCIHTRIKG